ncbi:hypothetical protein EJB05_04934, partial [Eragrostis curvula]
MMRSPPWRGLGRCLRLALPLLLSLAVLTAGAHGLADDDARPLLAFRDAVGRHLPWNDTGGPCKWLGVSCDASGRVAGLRLPGAWLSGQVPAGTLGNLTALRTLSLRSNALSGGLPDDLASASALRNVFLDGNRLSGEFPRAILELPGLARLALGENNLSGHIPAALGNLTRLRTLLLDSNHFVGEIPEMTLPMLEHFNVSFNPQISGSIPAELRSMPRSAFLGTRLCGRPLGPCRAGKASPSSATGQPASQATPTYEATGAQGGTL